MLLAFMQEDFLVPILDFKIKLNKLDLSFQEQQFLQETTSGNLSVTCQLFTFGGRGVKWHFEI